MSIPICPVHGSPMRAGTRGGFFCPRKVGEGYCDQRSRGTFAPTNPTNTFTPPAPQAPASPSGTPVAVLIKLGALDAASRVYQGTADPVGFLDLVQQILASHGEGQS